MSKYNCYLHYDSSIQFIMYLLAVVNLVKNRLWQREGADQIMNAQAHKVLQFCFG